MIIGLLAKKRHGKDTVADYLVEKYGFKKFSLADTLKDACKILFGFDDEQLYGDKKEEIDPKWKVSPRKMFQYLGTDIFRKQMADVIPDIEDKFWVKSLEIKIINTLKENNNQNIIVADCRFQNEVDMIHNLGGTVIKIVRPSISDDDIHESEKNIDLINNYDIIVQNNKTIIDLHKKIVNIIEKLEIQ